MRILDEESGRSLDRVTIYVTNREALELKDSLEIVIGSNEDARHEHISSEDYQKEITVCVYDPAVLENFSERSKKLLLEDV